MEGAAGAIGSPILTLAGVTRLPVDTLSAMVGRQLPFFAVLVPSGSFGRWPAQATSEVWPAALGAGASFGVVQFLVSNFIGPELVGILASLASIGSLLLHLQRQRQRPRPRHGGRQGPAGGRQAVADGRRVRLESEVGG